MDEIEKLFRKISQKQRKRLSLFLDILINKKHKGLNIKKLQNSDFYRARKSDFRIIFHYNSKKEIIIDAIRLRKEGTYKEF